MNLVAAGAGVSLVPESVAAFRRPGVTYRPLTGTTTTLGLAVAYRAGDESQLVSQFVATVLAPSRDELRRRPPT